MQRKYGWKRQLPDHRDHKFAIRHTEAQLPASVDLRPKCPPVWNQGDLGACTAHGKAYLTSVELADDFWVGTLVQ